MDTKFVLEKIKNIKGLIRYSELKLSKITGFKTIKMSIFKIKLIIIKFCKRDTVLELVVKLRTM